MKLLLSILLTLFVAVIAQRNSFSMTPMDWTSVSVPTPFFSVVTKKDLLVYPDLGSGPTMAIRRRNAEGFYINVANYTESASLFATTNGKWIGVIEEEVVSLFRIDENNVLSNTSQILVDYGFLLSDDTFVGFSLNRSSIETYEYSAATNTWTEVADTSIGAANILGSYFGSACFRALDSHLVIVEGFPAAASVKIYERQADLSWILTETVPINNTADMINNIFYNGVDTLIYSSLALSISESVPVGIVFIYTKTNGQWIEQIFTVESVGYRPIGLLGMFVEFLDANSAVITAGLEGYEGGSSPAFIIAGKLLLITRNLEGLWEPALDLVGPNLFGVGVGVNDYEIISTSLSIAAESDASLTFYTVPLCFTEPMDVTCNNQQVNDCSDVSIEELYTINNPQCGAVSVSVNGLSLVNNQEMSAQLKFTRGYGADFSCNATVTCPVTITTPVASVNSADARTVGLVSFVVAVALTFF